eukprot:96790-Chlamydomonas_euryale.AAC.2
MPRATSTPPRPHTSRAPNTSTPTTQRPHTSRAPHQGKVVPELVARHPALHAACRVEQRLGDRQLHRHKPARVVVVLGRVVEQHVLAQAVALAGRTAVLERCVRNVRLQPKLLVLPLHKESVAARKDGHREYAHRELAVVALEEVAVGGVTEGVA